MEHFLDSLSSMSLTNTGGSDTASRRRMLASTLAEPETFLQMNAFIFLLMGIFLGIYIAIIIFQKNIDSCCSTCPRAHFYTEQICIFMQKRFKWIYFDFIAWIAYLPFLYFALVQLKNFGFQNFLAGFSSLLSLVIVVAFPLYPVFICYLIRTNYNALVLENDNMV